jgi:enterobacterial common antigen flippase
VLKRNGLADYAEFSGFGKVVKGLGNCRDRIIRARSVKSYINQMVLWFSDTASPSTTMGRAKSACGVQMNRAEGTHGEILRSSAVVGGSSVVNVILGIVRTKVMALLLGPSGVGLIGVFYSIADLAKTIAGMGINSSGVRQIAKAMGTGDAISIARTVTTLRRAALLLGIFGAVLLIVFCLPISVISFGDRSHAFAIGSLSLVVLLGCFSGGQLALVQGVRRIGDLARASIWGGVWGTVTSIGVIWLYACAGDAKRGIVPSLVCVALLSALVSWWYGRKTQVERVTMHWADISAEVSELFKLGFVFMASGFMGMGVAYLTRIIVLRRIGEDAAGFYQSAWTLGGLYVGFILQAMGADFFPRLTAVAKDNHECNRLVNEQAEVGLLLAGPGVLGTLTFAPLVIQLFYSAKFGPAVELLRWICLGMVLRVAGWPMGYMILAKGARQVAFWTEVVGNVVHVALTWSCVLAFGLKGTGIAFFLGYVFYWLMMYTVTRSTSGFRWSRANRGIGLLFGGLISVVFAAWYVVPPLVMAIGGSVITLLVGVYSLKTLCKLVPLQSLPRPVRQLITLLRLAPGSSAQA